MCLLLGRMLFTLQSVFEVNHLTNMRRRGTQCIPCCCAGNILYIKLNVCLFVPYINSHFWTNLNQTLHTSPPWSGRDRRVCMVRKCLTFSTFLAVFVASEYRILGTKWLAARVIRDSVISVILAGVWHHGNDVVADDNFAFLLQVSCTMGNS